MFAFIRLPGFLPADNVGRAQVDVVIETIGDSDFDVGKWFFEKDEVKKVSHIFLTLSREYDHIK